MKEFAFFIQKGEVKRESPDKPLVISLAKDAVHRLEYATNQKLTESNCKYVLENAYEALRELADALLHLEGYKSYSHEASIAFLRKFSSLTESELNQFDTLRKKRNGSKYYGEAADVLEAKEALQFANTLLPKLKKLGKIEV